MHNIYDKKGRAIEPFDVLKVYHFTGSRRKRHYMYKHVLGIKKFNNPDLEYLQISSLSHCGHIYHEVIDGRVLFDYEIVQGRNLEKRPTRSLESNNTLMAMER